MKDHYFLFLNGKTQTFLKNKDFLPNTILKSKILNPPLIGLLHFKTGLISWIATKFSLNIYCETKLGLVT